MKGVSKVMPRVMIFAENIMNKKVRLPKWSVKYPSSNILIWKFAQIYWKKPTFHSAGSSFQLIQLSFTIIFDSIYNEKCVTCVCTYFPTFGLNFQCKFDPQTRIQISEKWEKRPVWQQFNDKLRANKFFTVGLSPCVEVSNKK